MYKRQVESGGSTVVTEGASTDTFTVVLDAIPGDDVILSLSLNDDSEVVFQNGTNAHTVTFTSENWDTAQTITVTGVDDNLIDGDQDSTITISVDPSSDDNFDSLDDEIVTATTEIYTSLFVGSVRCV